MKRFRLIVPSFLAIIVSMLLIAGSTLALFTSEAKTSIAVTSGKVEVSAELDTLKVYSAKAVDAYAANDEVAGEITEGDFASKYIFDLQERTSVVENKTYHLFKNNIDHEAAGALLEDGELSLIKMTPGDRVTANLSLGNESNVSIKYRVRVYLVSGLKLFNELKIKLDGVLLQGVSKTGVWTTLPANSDVTDIAVEVIFPLTSGNTFQDLSTKIKFVIEAVQDNAATTNETLNTNINVEQETQKEDNVVVDQVLKDNDELVTVTIPAAVVTDYLEDSTTEKTVQSLAVKVEPQTTTDATNYHITNLQTAQSYDLEVLVKTQTGSQAVVETKYNEEQSSTASALKIQMFVGTGLKGVKLYHTFVNTNQETVVEEFNSVSSESLVSANKDYFYNEETGYITLMTNSFSEYTVAYNKDLVVETVNEVTNESTFTTYEATETAGVYTKEVKDEQGNVTATETFAPVLDEAGEIALDANGEIEVTTFVAKIGDVHYESLKDAAVAAHSGDIIEVIADFTTDADDYSKGSAYLKHQTYIDVLKTGVTLDGQGHTITMTGQTSKTSFISDMYGFAKDITVVGLNDSFTSDGKMGFSLEKVTIYGDIETSGNNGAFVTYVWNYNDNHTLLIKDCVNGVNLHGTGTASDYNAAFVGYFVESNYTVTFENCKNTGNLVCGSAGLFIGNVRSYTATIIINNFKNEGLVHRTYVPEETYRHNQVLYGTTSDWAATTIIDGVTFTMSQINAKEADNLFGNYQLGTSSTLAFTRNEDGTYKLVGTEGAASYTVGIGLYCGTANGSGRYYATETLTAAGDTHLAELQFVDAQWLEAHDGAEVTHPEWNEEVSIVTLGTEQYYLVASNYLLKGAVTPFDLLYAAAYDSDGNLIASVGLSE